MTKVFIAGPIDFHAFNELADYRRRLSDRLQQRGFTPIDQYSAALSLLPDDLGAIEDVDLQAIVDEVLSDGKEPYIRAVEHAITQTSFEQVLASPELVPRYTPDDILRDIVGRDLELVSSAHAVLAYLPEPSCGSMVEIVHAIQQDIPVVVQSDQPSLFVRYFADSVHDDIDEALDAIAGFTGTNESGKPTGQRNMQDNTQINELKGTTHSIGTAHSRGDNQ